jgi:hypothetical protein
VYLPTQLRRGTDLSPGPGSYNSDPEAVSISPKKYTIAPKTKYFLDNYELSVKNNAPGPGEYKAIDDISSSFRTSKKPSIAGVKLNSGTDRFATSFYKTKDFSPGPALNRPFGEMSKTGMYFESKYKDSQGGGFGTQTRVLQFGTLGSIDTPGPGNYKVLSDFGLYDD